MHNSHLYTFNEAKKLLDEKVFLYICQNGLKDSGMFTLLERREIAHQFYGIPYEDIVILDSYEAIRNAIEGATWIVRGVRSLNDYEEISRLIVFYDIEDFRSKLVTINIPMELREISSSRLISRIKEGDKFGVVSWASLQVVQLIQEKLFLR